MIVYKDIRANNRGVPAWLVGAPDVQVRTHQDNLGIKYYGIGPGWLVGERDDWTDIGDGYLAAVTSDFEPLMLSRTVTWCRMEQAEDLEGRAWYVPHVLSEDGDPLVVPTYGPDFLPVLSPEKKRVVDVACAARDALLIGDDAGIDPSLAARWACELICTANHIAPSALTGLGLLDGALVMDTLAKATGFKLKLSV